MKTMVIEARFFVVVAAAYVALLYGCYILLKRRSIRRDPLPRTVWLALPAILATLIVSLSLYGNTASRYRHDDAGNERQGQSRARFVANSRAAF